LSRGGLFVQTGAGLHFFPEGTAPGFTVVTGVNFRLSDRLSLPVFVRLDFILGDGTPTPVSFGTGLRYTPR
jgi:hypothetical protein